STSGSTTGSPSGTTTGTSGSDASQQPGTITQTYNTTAAAPGTAPGQPGPNNRQTGLIALVIIAFVIVVIDWFEAVVVRHLRGAGGQADNQVHLGAHLEMIAGLRERRPHGHASVRADLHVHEDVERCRDAIGRDPE